MNRPLLVEGEIYHVILRGVEQRRIFLDKEDYYRGIFSLFEFNTSAPVIIRDRRKERERFKNLIKINKNLVPKNIPLLERKKLVDVLAFCLMPNHIHLLVRQLKSAGISKFIQKLGIGYATYFNKRRKRSGHLFAGKFRAVHIKNDEQLMIVFSYIHSNSLAIIFPKWKETGIRDFKKAISFLKGYKWSSFQDYLGKKNFPSVTERKLFIEMIGGGNNCLKIIKQYLNNRRNAVSLSDPIIEAE